MAAGDLASRSNTGMADIQALLTTFKGTPATTTSATTKEDVSVDKANAYIRQIMESTQGLSAVSSGQKGAGMYGSSTNQLLTNDLLARTTAGAAALSSNKTTSQTSQQSPALSLGKTIAGAGLGMLAQPVLKAGAKKLGVDQWGNKIADSIFGGPGGGGAAFDIGSEIFPAAFDRVAVDPTGTLGNMAFMDTVQPGDGSGSGSSGGISGTEAAMGAAAAGAGIAAASAGTAAATAGGYVVGAEAATWGTAAAAASTAAEGAGLFETLASAAVLWIVCTELRKQGRMPAKFYYYGASEFAKYDERGKQGYYIWAIPAVKHLRAHPESKFSKLLEIVFNSRAEYLSAIAGCRGARKTLFGAVTTHGLYAACWILSRTVARSHYTLDQIKGASHV